MDLDKGGFGFQQSRVWLGPSLGWAMEQVQPSTRITLAGTYTVQPGDSLILVDVAGSVTIQLPNVVSWIKQTANQPATAFDRSITIKDIGGNANSFNITIAPFGSQQIDEVAGSILITADGGVVKLAPLIELTGWAVASGGGGGGPSPGAQWPNTINVKDPPFNAVGNGIADDTVALNAAFASVLGQHALVLIPAGTYKISDTVVVGQQTGNSITSFISINCPGDLDGTSFRYVGPDDGRPALLFAANKYASFRGLDVHNASGTHVNNVGIMMGGHGPGGGGNLCTGNDWTHIRVSNFHLGVAPDGNFGCSSEITYRSVFISNCDIGWQANNFNTLDQVFIGGGFTECDIGLDTGVATCVWVIGSSCGANTTATFKINQNSVNTFIQGVRDEVTVVGSLFVGFAASAGSVELDSCDASGNSGYFVIGSMPTGGGGFTRLTIKNSNIGRILARGNYLTMIGNTVVSDGNTRLPFIYDAQIGVNDTLTRCYCLNNNAGNSPLDDFIGVIIQTDISGFPFATGLYGSTVLKRYQDKPAPNTGTPYGTDYQVLSFVRSLSEGPATGYNTNNPSTLLATNATTAAGNNVLHFASVPGNIVPRMCVIEVTTPAAIPNFPVYQVISVTSTTVTLNNNVAAPGVGNGDTIQFISSMSAPTEGKNLRVSATFPGAGTTVSVLFVRTISYTYSSRILTATSGRFYPTDVGKPVKLVGVTAPPSTWTDLFGYISRYIDSTHVAYTVQPGSPNSPSGSSAGGLVIGENEPDANYVVAGLCGDANQTFWVTGISSTGFTLNTSTAGSTATVTALIVR